MKKYYTLIIIFLLKTLVAEAQTINWVNAPVNPLPKGASLDKTQLKGDVFQDSFTFYDNKGNWLDIKHRKHIKFDNYNRPISATYTNGKTLNFKYDANGNLIYDEGKIYEYDAQNRIKKAIYSYKTEEYSYIKQGDLVIVTITSKVTDKLPTTKTEYYRNGLLTARKANKNNSKTFFKYQYDSKGNWIQRTETNAAGNMLHQYNRSIIYHREYKDFEKNAQIKKTTGDLNLKGGLAIPHLYINGKLDNTSLWNKFNNDYIFFNPLTNTYYIARNALDTSITLNTTIPFEFLLQSENSIISDGKSAMCIERGIPSIFSYRKWKYQSEYKNIIARDTKSKDVYFAESALQNTSKETKAYPAISMTSRGNSIWYIPSEDKEHVSFFIAGKRFKDYKIEGYVEGTKDYVFSISNVPTYVLSNFANSKPGVFNKGRYFNISTDKISGKTNTTQPQNNKTENACIKGNCTNGYGTYVFNSGSKVFGFFKSGKLHGYAQFFFANGNRYDGDFYNGYRNGFGIYYWNKLNEQYYGHWKDGKQHGYGYYVKNNKTFQAGIYTQGKLTTNLFTDYLQKKSTGKNCLGNCQNGYGAFKYNQGDVYVGFFKNGLPYKAGAYRWANKNFYVGDWDSNGKINYSGMFKTPTYVYSGAFAHNGYITGLGVRTDVKTFTQTYGEFKNGQLIVNYANGYNPANSKTMPQK
ncbi:hypothetical protein [Tenacibaculum sp. A30]|uniref:hypothetical protein n=1 Tax=Tenacibaculum sp. A30 TaxID=3442644 RepID=UPI003EBF20B5